MRVISAKRILRESRPELDTTVDLRYTTSMTMSREEKNRKTGMLKAILGGHQERVHGVKLRREMEADHGTDTYTAQAWRQHRMGRGAIGSGDPRGDKTVAKIQANRAA